MQKMLRYLKFFSSANTTRSDTFTLRLLIDSAGSFVASTFIVQILANMKIITSNKRPPAVSSAIPRFDVRRELEFPAVLL